MRALRRKKCVILLRRCLFMADFPLNNCVLVQLFPRFRWYNKYILTTDTYFYYKKQTKKILKLLAETGGALIF